MLDYSVQKTEHTKLVLVSSCNCYIIFCASQIDKVSIMGKDRFLVAYTTDTLLVGDLTYNKLSEVCMLEVK